jgi:protein-L-isoaspartate(D-aspartate) O-methyltransferase
MGEAMRIKVDPGLSWEMAERQIVARGVRSPLVLEAMRKVPREVFVPPSQRDHAWEDRALPLEEGQTIAQPYVVALMTEALELKGGERVLEIGTGSGYATAILAEIAGRVYTLERLECLAESAAHRLARLGYQNVRVIQTDGTLGWPQAAPYDAIVVTAGAPTLPSSLPQQLVTGGRLVVPVGSAPGVQELVRVRRVGPGDFREEPLGGVRFVPLVGAEGWPEELVPPSTRASSPGRTK